MKVFTLRRDVTDMCQDVPAGYKVIEKGLTQLEHTYCCSLTPASWIEVLRYDLECLDGQCYPDAAEARKPLLDYEQALNENVFDCSYYMDRAWALRVTEPDGEYESLEDAREFHQGNHIF